MNPALKRAFAHFDSLADMARQMGVSYQAVQDWKKRGTVPASRIPLLSDITKISRDELMGWDTNDIGNRIKSVDDLQGDAGGSLDDSPLSKMVA